MGDELYISNKCDCVLKNNVGKEHEDEREESEPERKKRFKSKV